jgi:uncharacterized protein (TIGR02594 family)
MATPEQIVAAAVHELGTRESPNGSNDGPRVHQYQSATGAYRAAWCASFVQFVLREVGIGPIANDTAGAYYMGDYARSHGWTRPTPAPGCVVVYHIGQGHVGIVEKPSAPGTFFAIEGNENNGVNRVLRRMGEVYCIFTVPGTKPKPRRVQVPRFEFVSSSGGHAQVRAVWGKWSRVGPQVPRLAARYRDVRVRRKIVTVTK